MTLTDQDIANTERLMQKLHKSSKAETVRTALQLTTGLTEIIGKKDEVIVRHPDGSMRQLIIYFHRPAKQSVAARPRFRRRFIREKPSEL